MLTISADLSELSPEQRQSLSNFVLTYPEIERRAKSRELPSDVVIDRRLGPLPTVDAPALEPSPEEAFSLLADTAIVPAAPHGSGTDKGGLPWDERIHSSSKALTADGLWRRKRGVDDAKVAQVEGQLKQLMSIPAPASETVITIPASQYVPPAPGVPAPPAIADEELRQSFIKFIGHVSEAIQAKKITMPEVQGVLDKYGIPTLPLLTSRYDLVPIVAMDVEAIIVSR